MNDNDLDAPINSIKIKYRDEISKREALKSSSLMPIRTGSDDTLHLKDTFDSGKEVVSIKSKKEEISIESKIPKLSKK